MTRVQTGIVVTVISGFAGSFFATETAATARIDGYRVLTAASPGTLLSGLVVGAAIGAVLAFGAPWTLSVIRQVWSYNRDGHRDSTWRTRGHLAGNAVSFDLLKREGVAPSVTTAALDRMECRLRDPFGDNHVVEHEDMVPRVDGVGASWFIETLGDHPPKGWYEVRWYGSCSTRRRSRFYEITRDKFELLSDAPGTGWSEGE